MMNGLFQIESRRMVPIQCPLKFVQGYRCSHCPWARLLTDCHVEWAVPVCDVTKCRIEFARHTCRRQPPLVVLQ